MLTTSTRLAATLCGLLIAAGLPAPARADLPLFPPQPCPPNSSCAPGTPPTTPPTPPGTCGPGHAGSTCGGGGPATNGNGSGINIGAGNPINVINGNKYQREVDMAPLPGTLGLEIVRYYNSAFSRPGSSTNLIGRGWKLSYETELYAVGRTLQIIEADGTRIIFNRDPRDASLCASADPANGTVSIVKTARGDEYVWRWTNGRELTFDNKGHLTQILAPGGQFVSLRYSPAGLLTRVTDPQGRSLDLVYPNKEQARSQDAFRGVQSIVSPVGRFVYRYGSPKPAGADIDKRLLLANLVKVEMPAGARTYHYEQAEFPTFLTGISELVTGADGKPAWQRVSTYAYDHDGKANLSVRGRPARLALGKDGKPLQPARLVPGTGIGQVTLEFGAGQTIVTNSLGQKTLYRHAVLAGEYRLLEVRGAGCSACGETNVRYTYDNLARLETTTRLSAAGEPLSAEHQQYDRRGRLASVSTLAYAHGKALPARLKLRYEYDDDDVYPARIVRPSVVPGRSYVTSFRYAGDGALAGLPAEITEQGYLPTLEGTGAAGTITRTLHYRYDGYGQRVEIDGPLPNAANDPGPQNSDITRVRYDARTKLPVRVDAPGGVVTEVVERDAALRPTVTRFTDAAAVQVVRVRYNWRGQPEELRVDGTPTDGSPALSQTVHYTYDLNGKLTGIVQPGRLTSRFVYDAAGRMTRKDLPDGTVVTAAFDTEGHQTDAVLQGADGRRATAAHYRIDEAGRVADMADDQGVVARASFTPAGTIAELTNALGIATRFSYGDDGMLAARTSAPDTPDAASIGFAYDAHGNRVRLTDANGVTTVRRFDDFGRPMLEVSPDRGVTLFYYDEAGRMVVRSDGRGNDTRYRYDVQGHLIAAGTTAHPELTRFRYLGRRLVEVVGTTDGNPAHARERTRYRYDAFGRTLEEERWLARVDVKDDKTGLTFVTTNTYDEAGRLSTRRLPDGHQLAYRYASAGGLAAVLFDDESIVSDIARGPAGIAGFTNMNGVREQIERDPRGQIKTVRATASMPPSRGWLALLRGWFGGATGSSAGSRTIYAQYNDYDDGGRLVKIGRELGQAGTMPVRRTTENYDYDALDRLTRIRADDGPAVRYAYDKGGNRTRETHEATAVRVSSNGETQAGTRLYLYAPGSNRLVGLTRAGLGSAPANDAQPAASMGRLFDSAWFYRPSGAPFARIGFAALGSGSKDARTPTSSRRIVYDDANRPMAVYDASDRLVASYAYNSQGERIAKTVFAPSSPTSGVVRTALSGDGKGVTTYSLYRDHRLAAEADSEGHITAHYVYLDDKPVARIDMTQNRNPVGRLWQRLRAIGTAQEKQPAASATVATIYAIQTDHLGTPQAVTDEHQDIVWQARISPFGQAKVVHARASAETGKAFDLTLRLPGQVFDSETGLNQNYFRDYDPTLGRYTTPDPMGVDGGVNPFAYVNNNPLTGIDPLGLYQSDIHFYMTMFLGIAAGMTNDDAFTLALAAQFVDENDDTRPLNIQLAYGNHIVRLLSYHFTMVPSVVDPNTGKLSGFHYGTPTTSTAYANIPENPQLQRLYHAVQLAQSETNLVDCRGTRLQLMGEYLHSFEDTFAHRDPDNHPFPLYVGLGHAYYNSDPDFTYVHDARNVANMGTTYHWNHNEERTLQMEQEVYAKLTAWGDPSKAIPFDEFKTKLEEFNATHEHEGAGGNGYDEIDPSGSNKIKLLQQILNQWVSTGRIESGVNWTGDGTQTYTFDVAEGKRNRNKFLCDADGYALDQRKYEGTILPECRRRDTPQPSFPSDS
jgi:RHS repeat-associated protein